MQLPMRIFCYNSLRLIFVTGGNNKILMQTAFIPPSERTSLCDSMRTNAITIKSNFGSHRELYLSERRKKIVAFLFSTLRLSGKKFRSQVS